ncbi:MAG: hypothetical protein GKR94_18845 [Gammaproteobacteria bacterium]|nr:hypothetical protein [Gammaproteobacteria bacterium]
MHSGIADTFTSSLTKLTGDEQKQAKTAAFDLQVNPAYPAPRWAKVWYCAFAAHRVKAQVLAVITGPAVLASILEHLAKGEAHAPPAAA